MIKKLIAYIYYFRYPQVNWSFAIIDIIKRYKLENSFFYDAPCGDGIISFWIKVLYKKSKVYLIDLSEQSLSIAKKYLPSLFITNSSLESVKISTPSKENVWLMVNSLYLLKNANKIIQNNGQSCEYIIGIFPYITSENYEVFKKNNPSINDNEMNKEETISFFNKNGFLLIEEKELTKIAQYKFSDNKLLYIILKRAFVLLDFFLFSQKSHYWLGLFKKTNEE